MLGYLKSYEVIQATADSQSCLSCSVCVPDGQFETDIDKRRKLVVRVGERAEKSLDGLEAHADVDPPEVDIVELLEAVGEEARHGRSLIEYINGWTIQLRDTTNGSHRGALWTRLHFMGKGQLTLQPEEFVDTAQRILDTAGDDALSFLNSVIRPGPAELSDDLSLCRTQALLAWRLSDWHSSREHWLRIIELSPGTTEDAASRRREAHDYLARLYDPSTGALPDARRFRDHQLARSRNGANPEEIIAVYGCLDPGQPWTEVVSELNRIKLERRPAVVAQALVTAWLDDFGSKYGSSDPNPVVLFDLLGVCDASLERDVQNALVAWPLKDRRFLVGHRGALWLRSLQLAKNFAPWAELHFVRAVGELLASPMPQETVLFLRDQVLTTNSKIEACPEAHEFRGEIARCLGNAAAEAAAYESYLRAAWTRRIEATKIRSALEHLLWLYASDGPLPNGPRFEETQVRWARLSESAQEAMVAYQQFAASWLPSQTMDEVETLLRNKKSGALLGLLAATSHDVATIVQDLNPEAISLLEAADVADAEVLAAAHGAKPFRYLPQLSNRLAYQVLSVPGASEADLILGMELCAWVFHAGLDTQMMSRAVSQMVQRESKRSSEVLRALRALRRNGLSSSQMPGSVYKLIRPLSGGAWNEWCSTFPPEEMTTANRLLAEVIISDFYADSNLNELSDEQTTQIINCIDVLEGKLAPLVETGD